MCLYCNIRRERQACLKESCIVSRRTCNARAYGERQGLTTSSVLFLAAAFHAYGNAVILTALYYGGTFAGVERFQARGVAGDCGAGVTSLSGTPTMFVALLEEWERTL